MFAAGLEVPGAMAAVMGLSGPLVAAICREGGAGHGIVVLANHNSEGQVAISGEVAAVAEAGRRLAAAGARKVIPLNVSGAFHSPLLRKAGASFREFLREVPVADPAVPLITNVDAGEATTAAALIRAFGAQLTAPVLWHDTMELLAGGPQPPAVVLEVGPGRVLTSLAKRAYPKVKFLPVGTLAEIDQAVAELAGLPELPHLE
jgi:[acyl-carrier-protein] S-malonyltransferase